MININTGFHVGAALPLDDRSYLTKAQMLAINENIYPDYFLAICSEDGFVYMFDKSIDVADVDPQTGKFKLFVGDVEEAIRILNGNVDTEGSVLYSIFNNAKNAEYQTVTKDIYTVDMSDFGASDIAITPEQKQSAENGETVEIATGYELTHNNTNTEYIVTRVSDSESHIVTLTAGTINEITTLKQKIDAVEEEAEVELREYTLPADITPGYLKTYELFQNNVSLGKIDIPKDLVVTSGTTIKVKQIEDPESGDIGYELADGSTYTALDVVDNQSPYYGYPVATGTYIKLVIANQLAPVIINAADLVDTGSLGKITEDVTANVEVGGVAVGDIVTEGSEITDVIKQILIKYFPPEIVLSSSVTNTVQRVGTTLSNMELTATVTKKSNDVTEIIINNETISGEVSTGGTFTHTVPTDITTNTTLTATATDGKSTSTASITYTFVYPYYHGVLGKNSIDEDTDLTSLTEVVEKQGSKTFSYTANNQYCVFAYPSTYPDLVSILDPSNFENITSWTKTTYTTTGGESYKVYFSNTRVTCNNFKYAFK